MSNAATTLRTIRIATAHRCAALLARPCPPARPRRGPHPYPQTHRPDQLAAAGIRQKRSVARAGALDPTAGLARSPRPQLRTQTATPALAQRGRPRHHLSAPALPTHQPRMALVRPADHRPTKPQRTHLNSVHRPLPPRPGRAGGPSVGEPPRPSPIPTATDRTDHH